MKRSIFFVVFVVAFLLASVLSTFAATPDLLDIDQPGVITYDHIRGSFVVNNDIFESFVAPSSIASYAEVSASDWFSVYFDVPKYGVVWLDDGDQPVLFDAIRVEFDWEYRLMRIVFLHEYTETYAYSNDGGDHLADQLYFSLSNSTGWGYWLDNWFGSDELADAARFDIASWFFSTDLNTGESDQSGLTYPFALPPTVDEGVFDVFSDITSWIVSTFSVVVSLFWDSGLTFFGILSVSALGIGIFLLLLKKCSDFLHFRS